jgi:hypothetical protein
VRRPSSSMLVAVAALFFALGGPATAGTHYLITSTKQIKPIVLRQLERAGLRGISGPRGAAGPAGPTGPVGAVGAAGAPGSFTTTNVVEETGTLVTMCPAGDGPCSTGGSSALCPAGAVVLGGGWSGPVVDASVGFNDPVGSGTAWDVVMTNDAAISQSFTPYSGARSRAGRSVLRGRRSGPRRIARRSQILRSLGGPWLKTLGDPCWQPLNR